MFEVPPDAVRIVEAQHRGQSHAIFASQMQRQVGAERGAPLSIVEGARQSQSVRIGPLTLDLQLHRARRHARLE